QLAALLSRQAGQMRRLPGFRRQQGGRASSLLRAASRGRWPLVTLLANSTSLVKSDPTPAFILARVCAAEGAGVAGSEGSTAFRARTFARCGSLRAEQPRQ